MNRTLSYIDGSKGKNVTHENCRLLTGYTPEELLGLTGIYGKEIHGTLQYILEGIYPVIDITIKSSDIEVMVTIDLEKSYIRNNLLIVTYKKKGTGAAVLRSQVAAAAEASFKTLECEAARGVHDDGVTIYNGYITWGILGFLMNIESADWFKELMSQHNRNEETLYQLLVKSDRDLQNEGRGFWERHGDTWEGIFSLEETSRSRDILNTYGS